MSPVETGCVKPVEGSALKAEQDHRNQTDLEKNTDPVALLVCCRKKEKHAAPNQKEDTSYLRIKAEETRQGGRGVEALTLRGVTRHAGVSATAAVPHFGTLTGLRSALAAQGYTELAQRLLCALEGEIDGRERGVGSCLQSESRATSLAAGAAYIEFALDNPDLFRLMFRRALLDYTQSDLAIASDRAFQALRSLSGKDVAVPARPALMAGLWGRVHGLAVLAIDDMLGMFETEQGAEEGSKKAFLLASLEAMERPVTIENGMRWNINDK